MTRSVPDDLQDALVVAVDDSPPAREALRFAAGLAAEAGRPLHVVTVWNFVMGPAPVERDHTSPPSEPAWQAEAERRLGVLLLEELAARQGLDVRTFALHGNTVRMLLAVTERAHHLVLGSRGRGGFAGWVLRSTSDQLMHDASCPVTVVRHGCTDDCS